MIDRAQFRALIDPLLAGLNLTAEDIKSLSFDYTGFSVVVFDRDSEGRRIFVCDDVAKQTVKVHIARTVVD